MSHVMCQMSCVTCHMSHVTCFFLDKVVKLVRGGSVINGATPSIFFYYLHTWRDSDVSRVRDLCIYIDNCSCLSIAIISHSVDLIPYKPFGSCRLGVGSGCSAGKTYQIRVSLGFFL